VRATPFFLPSEDTMSQKFRVECLLAVTPPKTTRTIKHFGKEVVFKPLSLTDRRLVAELYSAAEASVLANTTGYREFTDQIGASSLGADPTAAPAAPAPVSAAPAPAASTSTEPAGSAPAPAALTLEQMRELVRAADAAQAAADAASSSTEGDKGPTVVTDPPNPPPAFTPDEQAQAEILLSGQPAQIAKKLPDQSKGVLLAALALEKAAPKPRASVLKALGG
jgi:hypothetical protein